MPVDLQLRRSPSHRPAGVIIRLGRLSGNLVQYFLQFIETAQCRQSPSLEFEEDPTVWVSALRFSGNLQFLFVFPELMEGAKAISPPWRPIPNK